MGVGALIGLVLLLAYECKLKLHRTYHLQVISSPSLSSIRRKEGLSFTITKQEALDW